MRRQWICRCDCGELQNISETKLYFKKSPRCYKCRPNRKTTKLYIAWKAAKKHRVLSKKWYKYDDFAKGIGPPPQKNARLSRYDTSKLHGPGNTFWSIPSEPPPVEKDRKVRSAKTRELRNRHIIAARKAGDTYEMIAIAVGSHGNGFNKLSQSVRNRYSPCPAFSPLFCSSSFPSCQAQAPPALPPIEIYFSPQGGCTEAVVKEINVAKTEILVQAYSFTSRSHRQSPSRCSQAGRENPDDFGQKPENREIFVGGFRRQCWHPNADRRQTRHCS